LYKKGIHPMAHILLIEPNTVLARTYMQAFEHVGHSTICARTAQDAVYAADDRQPDVVVLELRLGAHDGIEFLHEFRSYSEWQAIPVILHSSITPAQLLPLEPALQELGITASLYKPQTSLQRLISTVNQQIVAV
jgi:CheY-like chemotaxis protein